MEGYFWKKYLNDNGIAIKNSTQNFPFGVSFIVGHSHYRYHRFQHKPHFISVEKTLDDVEWRGGRSRIQFPPLTFQVLTKLYSRRKIFKMNFQFTEHKKKSSIDYANRGEMSKVLLQIYKHTMILSS